MANGITREQLGRMSSEDRHQLWLNAKGKIGKIPGAEETVALIENSGLDYKRNKKASVTLDSKIGLALQRIIRSEVGISAMLQAHAKGLPPLAGVDPLLRAELGGDYCKENESTTQAGYIVTRVMEGLGHKKTGSSSPLPVASVAHSGLTFVKLDGHNRVDVPHSKARTRIPLTEDALCGLFAETAAESRAFREWVLGHTKFRSHAHTARLMREEQIQKRPHVRPERWWRHWWCTIPGLQEQRETDIFLVFQTDDTNRRFALLVENKKRARFSPGQAAAYNAKARFMSGKAEYLHFTDFQTMVIAPAAFHEAHATECDKFDVYISYEAIGAYIPQFAQL